MTDTAPSGPTAPSGDTVQPGHAAQPAPAGRRERKKQKTRVDLTHHAVRLFSERGFDSTTTEEIAEAADVSQRTFFRHFPSKEAVLYADQDDLVVRVRQALDDRPTGEPILDAVRHAIMSLADTYETERDVRLLQAQLAATSRSVSAYSRAVVQLQWERELVAGISERLGVDPLTDARPEILAGAAMSALRVSIRRWTIGQDGRELPELVDDAFTALNTITTN